ncbi:MAG: ABC transporter permease [Lachnospira eligens]
MRRKLELLKLQIKSAFLSIPKIILGTIVTAVLVIAISTCIGIATAQDSDMRMKVAVVYPDYDDTENSDSADNNKEFRYIKMAFNYVNEIDTIKNVCTFEYTDRQQAIDGLRNNYYVMAIIVPENMISDIMSGENTPVEVVCQSEGVNNTSMIFREMVRAGGSDLATAEAGIYTFDDLFNGVLKNYRGLQELLHENELNDIYLSYALNRSIYFKTRDISVKEGLSTVQFYVCTAIVMLLLLSGITCAGNMKGRAGRLQRALKVREYQHLIPELQELPELALCI